MKIGIVRHYKVNYRANKLMNSNDFEEYVKNYDDASVIENKVELGNIKWDKCYCSDLKRAIITAKSIFHNDLDITNLLREVKMYPVIKTKIKIPSFLWSVSSRVAWKLNGDSQLETINITRKRVHEFLDKLDLNSDKNILIVSHGFFLLTLINELKSRGFKGSVPERLKNGCLYILEK